MGQRRVPRLVDERPGRRAGVVRAVRVTQQRRLQRRQRLADERRGVRGRARVVAIRHAIFVQVSKLVRADGVYATAVAVH